MKGKFSAGIIENFTRRIYQAVEDYIADPFRYAADALLRISPENLTVTLSDAEEILPDCESIRVGDLVEVTPEEQLVPSPDQVATLVARFCS